MTETNKDGDDDVVIPDGVAEDVFRIHTKSLDEAREASHRLANRLAAAQMTLMTSMKLIRKNKWKERGKIALTFFVTLYATMAIFDYHVENCAVLGRPNPNSTTPILFWEVNTEKICDLMIPFHHHNREERILEDPYLREQVEEVIDEYRRRDDATER